MIKRSLLTAAAVGVLSAVAVAGTAAADPSGSPQYRQLAGVGSDTTQDVLNALSDAVTIGGQKVLGSYDAFGSANITTKGSGNCTIPRPAGSGAGRQALLDSANAGNGCVQFARSSSLSTAAVNPQLTFIPFAVDGVSYATTGSSVVPRQLSVDDLKAYYTCDAGLVGTGPNYTVTPVLPQANSGTRAFFLQQIGVSEAQISSAKCVINGVKNGQQIQENNGNVLDRKSLVPFSIAQFIAQAGNVTPDLRGNAVLGTVDGLSPIALNGDFGIKRNVYNVIPTSQVGNDPYKSVFVGGTSLVCSQTAIIKQYGFALNPSCGSTATKTG